MSAPKYSSIPELYNGKNVLITGGTGFLGKAIAEKLLRSCQGINKIYLLVRPKKGNNVNDRLIELKSSSVFDLIRETNAELLNKLVLIEGDIAREELGISPAGQELLCENVSIILNSAATVSFDEPLRLAVFTNLRSLRELIRLSRRMKKLESFVHISTSYSNWFEMNVEEEFYPSKYDPHAVINLCESFPNDALDKFTPILKGRHANTYTFTKSLSERLAYKDAQDLPFAIVRPSIICSALKEPKVGWIDGYAALVPYTDSMQRGTFRSGLFLKDSYLDVIPIDLTTNLIIASSWEAANDYDSIPKIPKIYHSSTATTNTITWKGMFDLTVETARKYPPNNIFWWPQMRLYKSKRAYDIDQFITGQIPAYFMDLYAKILGRKSKKLKMYKGFQKQFEAAQFVPMNPVKIISGKYKALQDSMTKNDQVEFYFDPKLIKWPQYTQDYCFGIRKYIHKENENPLESVIGKKKLKSIKMTRLTMRAFAVGGICFGLAKVGQYYMQKDEKTEYLLC
ncbi:putative fatty acyl-CoA reductase CG5065 [Chironomus tepperi]|uniref:putative fatty acyl-CoA reductase CG5065 n=1 Tax=Chironomus tepperi TaxID=113505 RepID=UPI00391F2124